MSNRNEPDVTGLFILLIIFITVCAIGLGGTIISAITKLLK